MIITRSPLRITLGGGGTDLPSYYQEYGGFLVAGAIDAYVYVSIHRTFSSDILLRYSQLERVENAGDIRHPLIRAAFQYLNVEQKQLEITTMADIPAGTGLGSSGSFGTALLKALHRFRRETISQHNLAEMASHLEINVLKEPVGKQDQYVAAFGGINCYEFHSDHRVTVRPLRIAEPVVERLQLHTLLFCTGIVRSAGDILQEQHQRTQERDSAMIEHLHFIKEQGYRSRDALEKGDLDEFGRLMHEHWMAKKKRSSRMSNSQVDGWYEKARQNGAVGGKLIGAGGGGFLMFYCEDPVRVRAALEAEGLLELRFTFDYEGTSIIV